MTFFLFHQSLNKNDFQVKKTNKLWPVGKFDLISTTYFYIQKTVNSRQTASPFSNHKSHCQLVSSLNSCATWAQTPGDKQSFRWINEHVHTCTDAKAETFTF